MERVAEGRPYKNQTLRATNPANHFHSNTIHPHLHLRISPNRTFNVKMQERTAPHAGEKTGNRVRYVLVAFTHALRSVLTSFRPTQRCI